MDMGVKAFPDDSKMAELKDKIVAARRWVPVLVALMAATFSAYLVIKGLKHVWRPGFPAIATISVLIFALVYLANSADEPVMASIGNRLLAALVDGLE